MTLGWSHINWAQCTRHSNTQKVHNTTTRTTAHTSRMLSDTPRTRPDACGTHTHTHTLSLSTTRRVNRGRAEVGRGTEFDKTTCKVLGASRQPRLATVRASLTDNRQPTHRQHARFWGPRGKPRLATVRASLADEQGGPGDPGTVLPKQHSPASHDPGTVLPKQHSPATA